MCNEQSSIGKKRKRELSIEVPDVVSSAIASPLPVHPAQRVARVNLLDNAFDDVHVAGKSYSVTLKKGKYRQAMEDTFRAVEYGPQSAYFAVFDGHSGRKAAEFAADHLHQKILEQHSCQPTVLDAVRQGFLKTDEEFLQLAHEKSYSDGTTVVTAYVKDSKLYVASCGDSRCYLVRQGKAVCLTEDHTPDREDERQRIEQNGGHIMYMGKMWRVQGVLAVSRAIGDKDFKRFVTANPDVKEFALEKDDQFLILASDGLWNHVDAQNAADICLRQKSLREASDALVCEAYARGSRDNVSALVVDLKQYHPAL